MTTKNNNDDKPRLRERLSTGSLILIVAVIGIVYVADALNFLELTDTPTTYNDSEGYYVFVNENGSGLRFGVVSCTAETLILHGMDGINNTLIWNISDYGGNDTYEYPSGC